MTPGEEVAQVAHELLDPGPFGWKVRREDYRDFCVRNFIDGAGPGVFGTSGTNCALFARGCLTQAGVMPRGKRPAAPAITTWLGLSFGHRSWLRLDAKATWMPQAGDVFYCCSNAGSITVGGKTYTWTTWTAALDGHVGIVGFDGEGWVHTTYEGGGAAHRCKKSDEPKDLRKMARTLQGVWRPDLISPETST